MRLAPDHVAAPGTSPPAPRRRRRFVRPRAIFAVLGPGLIAANAGNDAGGIATYASAGSEFELLDAVHHGAGHRGAGRRCRRWRRGSARTPARGSCRSCASSSRCASGAFAVVCLLVANLGLVVSEFAGIGAAMEIFGVSRYISVPLAAVVILGVVAASAPTSRPSGSSCSLSLVFLAYPIAMIAGRARTGRRSRRTRCCRTSSRTRGVPPPRRRARRHHDHAVHAAVPGGRGRRPGHRARRVPARADRRRSSARSSPASSSMSILIATARRASAAPVR